MSRVGKLPAGKVLAIEQLDRSAPLRRALRLKGRRSLAGPWPGNALGTCRGYRELTASQLPLEQRALIETYVSGRSELDFPVLDLNLARRSRMGPESGHQTFHLAAPLRQLNPGRTLLGGRF